MISIIVTCYNESEIINEFIVALNKEISKISEEFEVIFVDNKSSDSTPEIIKDNIHGWLFKKDDYVELSNKSIYVLSLKKKKLNIYLKKAYSYAKKKYSVNNHIKGMNKIYSEI